MEENMQSKMQLLLPYIIPQAGFFCCTVEIYYNFIGFGWCQV